MENNVYDTTLYTDYADLPDAARQVYFKEFLKGNGDEKKLRSICRLTPLILAILTAALLLASAIIMALGGINILGIVFLVLAIFTLIVCIIMNERSGRLLYEQAERYAAWLKCEKRVLAELKPRHRKKKNR